MTEKDLNIIDKLLVRVDSLPDILHLRAAPAEYKTTEEDKVLLLDTYEKLDDILKEAAAFINVKFPGRQDHISGWKRIDFDPKIGDIKINTTDREHIKRDWRKGIFDLKGLLKSLRNEVILLMDEPKVKEGTRSNNFNGNVIYNEGGNQGEQNQTVANHSKEIVNSGDVNSSLTKKIAIGVIASLIAAAIIYFFTNN